jgi:hypothetical protein
MNKANKNNNKRSDRINNINKRIKNINRRINNIKPRQRNQKKFNSSRNTTGFGPGIPAATRSRFNKNFRVINQTANTMTVEGRDLIYSIPDQLTAPIQSTPVISTIPANPAYWTGTRIAALAAGYQNYRPLMMKLTYVPQCAVTQQGNVLAGTIWGQAPSNQNLQQTLRTSNGGMLTQCYTKAVSNITLASNLQFNLFRMAGEFNQESNPFTFIAIAVGCTNLNGERIIPGYFYIEYRYTLKNPIGNTIAYFNSGLVQANALPYEYNNVTIINMLESKQFNNLIPLGAVLQDDSIDEEDKRVTYNGLEVQLAEDHPIWVFACEAVSSKEGENYKMLKYAEQITAEEDTDVQLASRTGVIYPSRVKEDYYVIRLSVGTDGLAQIDEGVTYYTISSALIYQDYGKLTGMQFVGGTHAYIDFEVRKDEVTLVQAN